MFHLKLIVLIMKYTGNESDCGNIKDDKNEAKMNTSLSLNKCCLGGKNLSNSAEMLHEVGSISCENYDLITVVKEYEIHTSVEDGK